MAGLADRFTLFDKKKRSYLDKETGLVVSKQQRDKVVLRGGLSSNMAAKLRKITNPELSVSRPARGHSSLLKKSETERHLIAQARLEDEARQKELAEQVKAKKKADYAADRAAKSLGKLLDKQASKTVRRTKITKGMLRPGSYGARGKFNTYNEYLVSLKEAKASGVIEAYGLGMVGYHENTGQSLAITVFTMEYIKNPPIPEALFYERFQEEMEAYSYFVFQYYFIHLAFDKPYARKLFEEWKAADKPARRTSSTSKAKPKKTTKPKSTKRKR